MIKVFAVLILVYCAVLIPDVYDTSCLGLSSCGRNLLRGNDMRICECPDQSSSKCFRCLYHSVHLGDIPMSPSDSYIKGYKAGVIEGASQYGGMVIRPEDIEVPALSDR